MSEVMVTLRHVQIAKARHGGFCARGVSAWLKRHDMSLGRLAREGYPLSVIEAINDEFANKVARIAREQAE